MVRIICLLRKGRPVRCAGLQVFDRSRTVVDSVQNQIQGESLRAMFGEFPGPFFSLGSCRAPCRAFGAWSIQNGCAPARSAWQIKQRSAKLSLRPPHIPFEILPIFSAESPLERHSPRQSAQLKKNLVVLDRQPLPAFVSPGLKHEPPAACLHPLPKPMRFRAMAIVRLICPLWHSTAPSENLKCNTEALQKAAGFVVENAKWKCYSSAAHKPI